jgi:hypothetical protein
MNRNLTFFVGLFALALMVGYVRDLGKKAGFSSQAISLLERAAFLA